MNQTKPFSILSLAAYLVVKAISVLDSFFTFFSIGVMAFFLGKVTIWGCIFVFLPIDNEKRDYFLSFAANFGNLSMAHSFYLLVGSFLITGFFNALNNALRR